MKKITLVAIAATPFLTFAVATSGAKKGLLGLTDTIGTLLAAVTPILFALALLFFFYGLAMYILKAGDEKSAGLSMMIWGIIALFVMTSVYGLVNILSETVGTTGTDKITVPVLPTSR